MSAAAAGEEQEVRWRRRKGGGGKRLLAWLVVLGLAAVALALLSERNARSFALARDGGALVVRKGLFFPVGSWRYSPADPQLARAYAPVPAPPEWTPPEAARLDGGVELDQALFELLARWAREDVASGVRERIARGTGYVDRAGLLPGISGAQRDELEALRADAGYHEGRDALGRTADELRRARERLARTARSVSGHAGEAGEALRELDLALEALHRASRALGVQGPGAAAAAPPR